ncbi:putative ABC transporter permease [uncultured Limosilactobacillus sp.]|uniref:putative ABC transporter permease n=1 Tax=uncultured Limosilactobacillus sp. TaxID=2837629 RepID=UPI0025E97047|nr:putative ABC transporter permease [uncultured Limosilactobacillus sp.]
MRFTIDDVILMFFCYSFIGWLWETIYCSIRQRALQYRGFLIGPYCPVYGFAIVTIILCTDDFGKNLLVLFIVGSIVATIFEFFASLLLEKAFHMKLWDYSNHWGNLQGRVAPVISLFWGVGTVLLVRYVQPAVLKFINFVEFETAHWAAIGVALVMSTDAVITILSTAQFKAHAAIWEQRIHAENQRLHVQLLDAMDQHRFNQEKRRARLAQLVHPTWNERRMMHNYPALKLKEAPHLSALRHQLHQHWQDQQK